jgi:adenine-specific DNA-methyltransferase
MPNTLPRATIIEHCTRAPANPDDPEARYREIVPIGRRKRLGQYFTPAPVAGLMVRWIAEIQPRTVLDPAVGPGIFPRLLRRECASAAITAIDVDPVALGAARSALAGDERVRLVEADFLTWPDASQFDAVIANPPYLRHHDMAYAFDVFATIGRRNDITLSRLTNLYVLFILEICRRVHAGGRAAVVVPGEWMNANFGAPLKEWLLARGLLHTIIYWSHAATVFSDALTTASVLLIDKSAQARAGRRVRTIYVHDGAPIDAVAAALTSDTATHDALVVQTLEPATLLAHASGTTRSVTACGLPPVHAARHARDDAARDRHRESFLSLSVRRRASRRARGGARPPSDAPPTCAGACSPSTTTQQSRRRRAAACCSTSAASRLQEACISPRASGSIARRYLCAARKPTGIAWAQGVAPIWAGVFGARACASSGTRASRT